MTSTTITMITWSSPNALMAEDQHAICDAIIAALSGNPETSTARSALSGEWTITVCPLSLSDWKHHEPTPEDRERAAAWMREELSCDDLEAYGPPHDIDATCLGESAADALDLCLDDHEASIPEWVFEVAAEVAEAREGA